nr:MAG TPA: hypothetical protein [Caudoviricetes sp.]
MTEYGNLVLHNKPIGRQISLGKLSLQSRSQIVTC